VVLAERHEIPVVDFWLQLDAGYAADQFASPGTASMTTALLDGGTAKRTALQISEEAALLGAQLRAFGPGYLHRFLSALKSNLDRSLDLYADVICIRHSRSPISCVSRSSRSPPFSARRSPPNPHGLRVFPGLLYGPQHAYGNPLTGSGTEASVSKLTREDLVKFHDTWFKPNHATLIVVGDTTLPN
jgi:zinc protease